MTRIPHDSAELETWFAGAKQADRALAPGPAELESLGARLLSAHPGAGLHGTALLGAPAAKVALAVSISALAAGVALTPDQAPHKSIPTQAAASKGASSEPDYVEAPGPLPTTSQPASAPSEQSLTNAPLKTKSAPRPSNRIGPKRATPTWAEVNDALTEGNLPAARGALENFIALEDGPSKERAELALAQLELSGPRAARSLATLRRLAANAEEPSVRLRAQSLLHSHDSP